jgi:hypothetical protein
MHGSVRVGGDDCDDGKSNIRPGSMKCGSDSRLLLLCEQGTWTSSYCPSGGHCESLPGGTGRCVH